jgi:hypothetical protein
MKKALLIAMLVAVSVPAVAQAGTRTYTGNFSGGGSIKFKAKVQNGTPVKISGLKWTKLPLDCNEGTVPYTGGFSFGVTVAQKHFETRGQTSDGSVHSKLDGRFVKHGKQAKGYLKINGSFDSDGFHGCHSGTARFTAK